jgi:hypothetical protein
MTHKRVAWFGAWHATAEKESTAIKLHPVAKVKAFAEMIPTRKPV